MGVYATVDDAALTGADNAVAWIAASRRTAEQLGGRKSPLYAAKAIRYGDYRRGDQSNPAHRRMQLGIKVAMITGDVMPRTAQAIAERLG